MKHFITAAAVSVTLFVAGCSSDSTPAPQTTTPTTPAAPTFGVAAPTTGFSGGMLSANSGGFTELSGWSGSDGEGDVLSANIVTENGNSVYSITIPEGTATPDAPWNRNLQQTVAITQGKSYTIKFKARSDRDRNIVAGIGLNAEPWTDAKTNVALTSEWQDHEVTLEAANFGGADNRLYFDFAGQDGLVMLDEVSIEEVASVTPPVVAPTSALPLDFELAADSYTRESFGDAVLEIAADPVDSSNNALKMTRPLGTEWWSGGFDTLGTAVDGTTGSFTMDVYSTQALAYVELKLEQDANNFTTMSATHGGTGWETLTFDTGTSTMGGSPTAATKVVFTPRVTSDGSNTQTADEVYYIDNIKVAAATTPVVTTVALPLDYELSADSYTRESFGDAVFEIAADPVDSSNNALKMTRPLGTQWWSGGVDTLGTPVDATAGSYSMNVYSTAPLAYVELKLEQDGNNFVVMNTTHGGTGWETLTFDTSAGAVTGSPSAAVKVVFTPRVTSDGSNTQTADEVYYIDNIQAVAAMPTVGLPLNYELAADSYTRESFGDAVFEIAADPVDSSNTSLKMTRPLGTQWWSGGFDTVSIPVDATFGLFSMDVYSTAALAFVELKLEQDGDNFVAMNTTHGGTGWETLIFDTSAGAVTGSPSAATKVVFTPRVTSDGSNAQTADEVYYIDNIQIATAVPPVASAIALPLDFELSADSYTRDQFGDAVFEIAADPVDSSNNALKMTRPVGTEWWSGGYDDLDAAFDATSGSYSMDVYSTSALGYVELKFEQDANNFVAMSTTHGGSGWETLTFNASSGSMVGAPAAATRVVFTPRVTSDGSNTQTVDEVYYIDNIKVASTTTTTTPPPATSSIALPLDYELAADSYTREQFGDAVLEIAVDPVDSSNNALKMTRPVGTMWWSGGLDTVGTPVNATSGSYTMDVYSTTPLAYVELKFEQDGNNFVFMTTTHGGTGWETLSFDVSTGNMTGSPTAATKVVFTPRVTSDGSNTQTADEIYYIDNIMPAS